MAVGDQIPTSGIRAQVHRSKRGINSKGFLEFFDCPSSRQGVEDLREVNSQKAKRLAKGSKQVGFKQLGPGVETGVHEVHDEKRVWFEVELQGAHGGREAEVFQVSNDDTAVAQRWLEASNLKRRQTRTAWSTQQCMKSGVAKHLGVAGIQQQNGLVDEINVTLFAKVSCFLIQSGMSKVFWAEDTTRSTYLVNRSPSSLIGFKKPIDMLGFFGWLASIEQGMLEPVKVKCIFLGYHESIVGNKLWRLDDVTSKVVLYRNMGFNESGKYKKTFIGSGVGTGSVQVLQGVEFEEVQTQDLIYYHSSRDREQHSAWELFSYREDSNEAAFVVAVVDKIYAHESLTFNNTVSCEVISMWKAGLKEDMDVRSDVYVLSNGCRKSSDDSHDYYWELRSGLPRVCWLKQREIYLVGRSSGIRVAWKKEAIWLRGLLEELGVELNSVAVNCDNQGAIHLSRNHVFHERTKHINVRYHFIREVLEAKTVEVLKVGTEHNVADALTKVVPGHKLQHCLELLSVGIG
ncbi:zinc finger, CCHC-type containing protein [Tanacetum coccineum]